jgi:hypothetical protein
MDELPSVVSAMVNGVDTAVEVEILLRSGIFISDGRIHVVVVDEVMDPRQVSSQIYRVRDATSEPPSMASARQRRGRPNRIIEVLLQFAVILRRKNLRANNSASRKYLAK